MSQIQSFRELVSAMKMNIRTFTRKVTSQGRDIFSEMYKAARKGPVNNWLGLHVRKEEQKG